MNTNPAPQPDDTYRRRVNPATVRQDYCPGFNLWHVTDTNGRTYLVDSDDKGHVSTALYLRSWGSVEAVEDTVEALGSNPDAYQWMRLRGLNA